jgi:RNA polymerase sigma-70 factor (ECF subfamily)
VHQCLHQYRHDAPLKAWIAQVAYSVARRHLERKRIPIAEEAGEEGEPLHERVADEFDLERAVADDELSRRLHAAIERLPPLQRTILTLYHLDELPLAQIARITGLAEGTLKSHLFRSRKRLQEWLAPGMGVAA